MYGYDPDSMHRVGWAVRLEGYSRTTQWRALNAGPSREGSGQTLSASLKEKIIPP